MRLVRLWLPALLWMLLIYLFSAQAHSGQITENYLHDANVPVRKLAHMAEYAVLALLYRRALAGNWFAFLLTIAYAASDEWHQSFVPGRSASPLDVLVDAGGAMTALLVREWWRRRKESWIDPSAPSPDTDRQNS